MKSKRNLFWALSLTSSILLPTFASAQTDLGTLLKDFDANPQEFMDRLPEKSGKNVVSKFSSKDIRNKDYVTAKNQSRKLRGRAAISGNDEPEDLVDKGARLIRSLETMESKNLTSASLKESPWSDYYWSLYKGQLAYRYAERKFPDSESWKVNSDYLLKNAESSSIDTLSPAEKYDLLVGDERKSLTQSALGEGEAYYRSNGKVETWMGICHGWSPASYMLDRPTSAITVAAADGKTMITFYPSDIKALASLLWAKNSTETKFIGGRCNTKKPKKDRSGRIQDDECFDNNPGSWHMAVVNQIGVSKRSFVIDATYDYEVWNQPVYSYSYAYFNPETLEPGTTLAGATVSMDKFKKDKFKKYRSPKAVAVVGVSMQLTYVVENEPDHNKVDSAVRDSLQTVNYIYDLELDAKGNIIGGEWYNNAHPDFLWTPTKDAKVVTPGDYALARSGDDKKRWSGKTALPAEWQDVAKRTSQSGTPLAVIVESLIKLSNKR